LALGTGGFLSVVFIYQVFNKLIQVLNLGWDNFLWRASDVLELAELVLFSLVLNYLL